MDMSLLPLYLLQKCFHGPAFLISASNSSSPLYHVITPTKFQPFTKQMPFSFLGINHNKVIDATKHQLFSMKGAGFAWKLWSPRSIHDPEPANQKEGKVQFIDIKRRQICQVDLSGAPPSDTQCPSSSACPFTGSKAVPHARNWVGSVAKSRHRSLPQPFKATPQTSLG